MNSSSQAETHALAARFAHELASPMAAMAHSMGLWQERTALLLGPVEQKFYQAGLLAGLTPNANLRTPTLPHKKYPAALAAKLQSAVLKNKKVSRLASGLSATALTRALKAFDAGFAAKCAQLGLQSAQQIVRNLRSLGDYARKDLVQETLLEETLQAAWMLVGHREKNLNCQWKVPRLLQLRANPYGLMQVWTNIFTNAAQINKKGCQLEISANREGKYICVRIANSGRPLPAGVDIFAQGQSTRKEGRGLGLHLCRQIVTAHGGKIWAENGKNNNGAIFTVELPFKK